MRVRFVRMLRERRIGKKNMALVLEGVLLYIRRGRKRGAPPLIARQRELPTYTTTPNRVIL